jgi:hypothetical protein
VAGTFGIQKSRIFPASYLENPANEFQIAVSHAPSTERAPVFPSRSEKKKETKGQSIIL